MDSAEKSHERLIRQLTDANERLEQFACAASHDLREPLRIVVSFTDLLLREYGGKLGEEATQYMRICRQAAMKMEAMLVDLLDYSRLGQESARPAAVDCNQALAEAMESLSDAIGAAGAVIRSDALPVVMGNPVRLSRLFQNLVANAIKYQPPGRTPVIHVSAADRGEHWEFTVADNGIGIPSEHLDSIFAPFARLHGDREYPGSGIGLTLCRKIVEETGGAIWVRSAHGDGSIFFFTVPKSL